MSFLLIALGIGAGWLAGAAGARRAIRREVGEMREMIARQALPAAPPAAAPPPALPAPAPEPVSSEIPAEVLAVITAAVAAFLGKKARIRGIRRLPAYGAGAWAQQGRVYIQGSHNLQHRGF